MLRIINTTLRNNFATPYRLHVLKIQPKLRISLPNIMRTSNIYFDNITTTFLNLNMFLHFFILHIFISITKFEFTKLCLLLRIVLR